MSRPYADTGPLRFLPLFLPLPIKGFQMTPYSRNMFSFNKERTTPTGYCHGMVILFSHEIKGPVCVRGLAEATALRCPTGQLGKIVLLGLASTSCPAGEGVKQSIDFMNENYEALKTRFQEKTLYIDWEGRSRHGHQIEGYDFLLRIPEGFASVYLSGTMVVAIISMLWRKPPLTGWSVVGSFDPDGLLGSFPLLSRAYLEDACTVGISTVLVPWANREQLLAELKQGHRDVESRGPK